MRWCGHLVDCIRYGHLACVQHLLVEMLLLHAFQLVLQLAIVKLLADRVLRNHINNLIAKRILFIDFIPILSSVHRYPGKNWRRRWLKSHHIHDLVHFLRRQTLVDGLDGL